MRIVMPMRGRVCVIRSGPIPPRLS